MAHENCKEMLPMHALSALDGSDQRELQEHLETCAVCRLEFTDWEATAAALVYVAAPVEPSAQLRERILERVRNDDRLARTDETKVLSFTRVSRPLGSRWPAFAAIAAASIVFIGLSAAVIILWRQNRAAGVELARLSQELRLQQQKLASENKIVQILTAPGARSAELAGTKDAPKAHALLAVDRQ